MLHGVGPAREQVWIDALADAVWYVWTGVQVVTSPEENFLALLSEACSRSRWARLIM